MTPSAAHAARCATPSARRAPFVYTAVKTGMRWSELVGLRRAQVNLLRRTISVIEQLVFVGGDSSVGRTGRWMNEKPKTGAGTRTISISSFLAEKLEDQLEHRSRPGPHGLVIVNMRGGPIGGSIFNKRHWQAARSVVGLDGLRFHDLRHTAVALAIAQGAHPKAIQRRDGPPHDLTLTLDRYGHLFPGSTRRSQVILERSCKRHQDATSRAPWWSSARPIRCNSCSAHITFWT